MNRRVVWAIALGIVLLGAATAGWRMLFPGRFDTVRWRAADSPGAVLRRREMLPDINRMISEKMIDTKESALQQLGPPQLGDVQIGDVWLYDLGGESASSAPGPHQWLELRFDSTDRLTAHRVKQE